MLTSSTCRMSMVVALLLALLQGCGGGGGAADTGAGPVGVTPATVDTAVPAPVPTAATETPPTRATVDLLAQGFMPTAQGSTWDFTTFDDSGVVTGGFQRSLDTVAGPAGEQTLVYTENSTASGVATITQLRTADGLYADWSTNEALPAAARQRIGRIRQYAFPTYAAGEPRIVSKQGTWDEDLDQDGRMETFKFEYVQTYHGQVAVPLPWDDAASLAHFSNVTRVLVTPSSQPELVVGVIVTEHQFFARDVGLVRGAVRIEAPDGMRLADPLHYRVKQATVAGTNYVPAPARVPAQLAPIVRNVVSAQTVAVTHNHLVHDARRNVYYASVPAAAGAGANTIAVVSADGGVTYSQPVGRDPGTLALAPDGKYLFVGLKGAAQVVKLALPGLAEVGRVDVRGADPREAVIAESIAVSPADSETFAVTLQAPSRSPQYAGVALVRGASFALMPEGVSGSASGSNVIAFGADGSEVFGLSTTSAAVLRRMAVVPEGLVLAESSVTSYAVGSVKELIQRDGRLYFADLVFLAADLSLLGRFRGPELADPENCWPLASGQRVACTSTGYWLTTFDAVTFAPLERIDPKTGAGYLVPGPTGALAVGAGGNHFPTRSDLYLLADPAL